MEENSGDTSREGIQASCYDESETSLNSPVGTVVADQDEHVMNCADIDSRQHQIDHPAESLSSQTSVSSMKQHGTPRRCYVWPNIAKYKLHACIINNIPAAVKVRFNAYGYAYICSVRI